MAKITDFMHRPKVSLCRDGNDVRVHWDECDLYWDDGSSAELRSSDWLADDWVIYESDEEKIKRLESENAALRVKLEGHEP